MPELFFAYQETKKLYGCSCLVLSTGRASWEEITYHKELGYRFIILLLVLTAAPAWETGSKSCYEVPWTSRELKTCLLPGKCLSQRDQDLESASFPPPHPEGILSWPDLCDPKAEQIQGLLKKKTGRVNQNLPLTHAFLPVEGVWMQAVLQLGLQHSLEREIMSTLSTLFIRPGLGGSDALCKGRAVCCPIQPSSKIPVRSAWKCS